MIPSPFRYETNLTSKDCETLGRLLLRWSHTDHVIANCLKRLLRLTDDEAQVVVFQLTADARLERIRALNGLEPLPTAAARHAFNELDAMMKGLRQVRNNVAHAVLKDDGAANQIFESRKTRRVFTKAEIFETEELTNYAAHAALVLRDELGDKDPLGAPGPLPSRPPTPEFLQKLIPPARTMTETRRGRERAP